MEHLRVRNKTLLRFGIMTLRVSALSNSSRRPQTTATNASDSGQSFYFYFYFFWYSDKRKSNFSPRGVASGVRF